MTSDIDKLEMMATSRIDAHRKVAFDEKSFDTTKIAKLAQDLKQAFANNKQVAFLGNGGSAAEAMHLAAEFTGKCVLDHPPLPAICLNESQSALTAIANDYGVEHMFSRQVFAHMREGDILICLSTSGKSKNILNALEAAKSKNIRSIIWMGDFEFVVPDVEIWKVPEISTPRIQEIHLVWGHIIAELVEYFMQPINSISRD